MAHRVNLLQRSVCLLAKEQRTKRSSRASRDAGARSLHIENDTNDALDLLKPLWSEREGNFDPAIHGSVNVEDEPRRSEFDQAHTEVSGTPVGLVRLDIADVWRGDSHYGRVEAMEWAESNGEDYISAFLEIPRLMR
jgi:hypothetical protein